MDQYVPSLPIHFLALISLSCDRVVRVKVQPRIVPLPDDSEDEEGSDFDEKSRMTTSSWGAGKVTLQKPVNRGQRWDNNMHRESFRDAKYGVRLLSPEPTAVRPRSPYRSIGAERYRNSATELYTPPGGSRMYRQALAKGGVILPVESTVTSPRPSHQRVDAMGNNNTELSLPEDPGIGMYHQLLETVDNTFSTKPSLTEDSGVGLHRHMLAKEDATSPAELTVASPRPPPQRADTMGNNDSSTRLSSLPENHGVGMRHRTLANGSSLANEPPLAE